jgi:hypothetical protein
MSFCELSATGWVKRKSRIAAVATDDQGNWRARKQAAPGEIGLVSEMKVAAATLIRSAIQLLPSASVLLASSTMDLALCGAWVREGDKVFKSGWATRVSE